MRGVTDNSINRMLLRSNAESTLIKPTVCLSGDQRIADRTDPCVNSSGVMLLKSVGRETDSRILNPASSELCPRNCTALNQNEATRVARNRDDVATIVEYTGSIPHQCDTAWSSVTEGPSILSAVGGGGDVFDVDRPPRTVAFLPLFEAEEGEQGQGSHDHQWRRMSDRQYWYVSVRR